MATISTAAATSSPAVRFPALASLLEYLDSLTARADLAILAGMLAETKVLRAEIEPVCTFGTQGYRRNIISSSPWYELLALCWRSGHCTPIHDHRGSSCAFRVVEGMGTEIRFVATPSGLVCPVAANRMPAGYICAAEDEDIHQVANMQAPGEDLITLHIYSPPIQKMHTYRFAQSDGAENANRYD
jgi:cysteine dioxygenase